METQTSFVLTANKPPIVVQRRRELNQQHETYLTLSAAYLSAIIVYLYAHDFEQAEKCYNDCCQVDAFMNSDQNRATSRLMSAYTDGDIEEIKRAAQSSIVSNLDHVIIKLARKLPTGDISGFKRGAIETEDPLDEDDLT
ncbi:gamma-soluble NSF attachment protein-like [Salvia divinorum]|uniref:Gamma-soluble NSF attachment protein n=1 Tax=Salvia divinorum TaxID=28513 RepID=A0ABD1G3G6_SALDI